MVVRKDVFNKIDGFNESLVTDEDYDLGRRLTKNGYNIIDNPKIKVIHLGNPKTLLQFFRKAQWHATSGLKIINNGHIDRPMLMTIIFLLMLSVSTGLLIFKEITRYSISLIFFIVLTVPLVTAIFRVFQYRNIRHFIQLVILYSVFYFARVTTLVKHILKSL